MCGIAGTVFNKSYVRGIEVKPQEIVELIYSIKQGDSNTSSLLDLAWKYKSNINFLRYAKNDTEKALIVDAVRSINSLAEELKYSIVEIDKSISYERYNTAVSDYQNLLDTAWFLSIELNRWVESIEFLSSNSIEVLQDEIIILYKDITKVINAIDNRLELRGRDSFGIAINLTSDKFTSNSFQTSERNNRYVNHHWFQSEGIGTHCFSFKTCNSIGALGENASDIKRLIKSNSLFNSLVQSNDVNVSTIMAHTRWASVGKVNIDNAHPVDYVNEPGSEKISSILNGDIYNYKQIISEAEKNTFFSFDTQKVTNDCVAVPALISSMDHMDLSKFSSVGKACSGSFIISVTHSKTPEDIFIIKKGIQGLYLGLSYDGAMFASDVYGLVESCRYFTSIESDRAFVLSAKQKNSYENPKIILNNLSNETELTICEGDFRVSNITTRDIDRKDFEHFLDKEIHDTADIVGRTISNYVQPEKSINKKTIKNAIAISNHQIPEYIIDNLKNQEIKKVIITGMGTCYTAAVAISMYMRSRLRLFTPDMLVEPHVATEGSAFYLEPNMQDTLVIVIAQSGTTVDTNVYVQKAKERGAMSLAIANKREGDVTFIVDGTLYIGDGRDIEIAVPSTKTYTAQVVLGYILTLALVTPLAQRDKDKKLLLNDLKNLRNTDRIIDESLEVLNDQSLLHQISATGCKYNSWYILRDETSNAVCADEIRIKYSENCYQSVASLSLQEATSLSIKSSLIVIITESEIDAITEKVLNLLKSDNSIVLIANNVNFGELNKKLRVSENLVMINMPYAEKYFTFLPTILAGQILSYHQAMGLDRRKTYLSNLKASLKDSDNIATNWNKLTSAITNGDFNQGFPFTDFQLLNELVKNHISQEVNDPTKLNLINDHLDNLILASRRTIDTIKHQAKTITVGAVREESEIIHRMEINKPALERKDSVSDDLELKDQIKRTFSPAKESILTLQNNEFDEILIAFEGVDESLAYNLMNLINHIGNQCDLHLNVRLARSYDYPSRQNNNSAFWIILNNQPLADANMLLDYLDKNQYLLFDFLAWQASDTLLNNFMIIDENGIEFRQAFWSLSVGIFLSTEWLMAEISDQKNNQPTLRRINFELTRQLNILKDSIEEVVLSKDIHSALEYAAEVFLSRINWKCIGSGVNFNLSKYTSKRFIKEIGRACAFDVLENHKHIDMSAESAIFVFINNIFRKGYQDDAFSELEKLIAHNNIPIIVTNIGDDRFDEMAVSRSGENKKGDIRVPVIKVPKIAAQYSFPLNVLITEKLIKILKNKIYTNHYNNTFSVALQLPSAEVF